MRNIIHKWFWAWDFDKEEKWLNEMAAKGLALVAVGWCRYEFEDCIPGEYRVCMEFLENRCNTVENAKYIEFLEETGVEHVGTWLRWNYFRKKATEENFRLFSDHTSAVKHLSMIIRFIAVIGGANLFIGIYNLFLFYAWNNGVNILGVINLLCAAISAFGVIRLMRKMKRLKAEQQIFE